MQEIQSLLCFLLSPNVTKCINKGDRETASQMREIDVTLFHSDSVPGTAAFWPPMALYHTSSEFGSTADS